MKGRYAKTSLSILTLVLLATSAPAQDGEQLGELTPQEQLQALLNQGREQFSTGEYDAAAQTFTTIVNAYERAGAYAPAPLLFRAKAYANLEEYAAAIEDLKKAFQYAQQEPAILPEIQNTRAEVYMELEAYDAALPDVQAAAQTNRNNPQYQFNLGKTLVKLGGLQQGEQALTKYLEATDPSEPEAGVDPEEGEAAPELTEEQQKKLTEQRAEALLLRGEAFGGMRKFPEAIADLQASIEINPEAHEAHFIRAQIALAEEDYELAASELLVAIEKYTPKEEDDEFPYAQGMLTRASVMEELGKKQAQDGDDASAADAYAACLEQCVELLELLPENDPRTPQTKVATLFRRGVAERLLGQLGDAVLSFSQTLELDPNIGDAYFRRGICFHYLGEEALAVRDFEQAASINFDSPRANLWKGMSHARGGEYGEAIRAYGESIAVSDRYTPAYVNRGLAHLAEEDFAKAIADFNEAIRLQPTEAMHYYRRAIAQAMAEEREEAIRSYMTAIQFDPEFGAAYEAVALELDANGQAELASEYRRRASELGL